MSKKTRHYYTAAKPAISPNQIVTFSNCQIAELILSSQPEKNDIKPLPRWSN
jgi:hypothetical protein